MLVLVNNKANNNVKNTALIILVEKKGTKNSLVMSMSKNQAPIFST